MYSLREYLGSAVGQVWIWVEGVLSCSCSLLRTHTHTTHNTPTRGTQLYLSRAVCSWCVGLWVCAYYLFHVQLYHLLDLSFDVVIKLPLLSSALTLCLEGGVCMSKKMGHGSCCGVLSGTHYVFWVAPCESLGMHASCVHWALLRMRDRVCEVYGCAWVGVGVWNVCDDV